MNKLNNNNNKTYYDFIYNIFFRASVYCFIILYVCACNRSQKEQNNIQVVPGELTNDFIVRMGIIASEPDVVDFFYVLDSLNEKFSESKKLRKNINGGDELELIEFVLEEKKAIKLRLDLGRNLRQKRIKINYIEIQNNKRTLLFNGNLLKYFFNENKYMNFSDNGIILFSPNDRKTPFMTSSALLNKKMKIEF